MRICFLIGAVAISAACSTESASVSRGNPSMAPECGAGAMRACSCPGSQAAGMQACTSAGAFGPCQCTTMPPSGTDNPEPGVTPVFDAGPVRPQQPARDCSPGLYLGTYQCEIALFGFPVPLEGDVSFNLSINETVIDGECEPGVEFCSDLVISENGGTLFGLAGLVGFETMLSGALDCTTGEFRAAGVDGRYGNAISTDPNDPNALWTVEQPGFGTFEGELMGTHTSTAGETIAGMWNLREPAMDITCAGPFTVTLQP